MARKGQKGGREWGLQFEACRLIWEGEGFFLEEGGLRACPL